MGQEDIALDGVFAVGPFASLGGAAGANDGEGETIACFVVVGKVAVAMQPEGHFALFGDADEFVEIAQAAGAPFGLAVVQANWVVGNKHTHAIA